MSSFIEKFPTYGGYKTLKKLSKGLILNESTANDLEPKEPKPQTCVYRYNKWMKKYELNYDTLYETAGSAV